MRPQSPLVRSRPQSDSDDRHQSLRTRLRSHRGTALIETAMTLPLVLLVAVGILEFGKAYETWQVLTNAAREGARVAVLPNATPAAVQQRVSDYISAGHLSNAPGGKVTVEILVDQNATVSLGGSTTAKASLVTVNYPFTFLVLGPVASLVKGGPALGAPFMMVASAEMRNEAQ
jgi:Flp pilus assembly protein TadG